MLTPYMPEAELEALTRAYAAAGTILEYGSGGSTRLAATMPGKLVFSVESDPVWAASVQAEIDAARLPSTVVVYHADVGHTGPWGLPLPQSDWRMFHRYPLAIWDEPFFRHPDVVLVDGRFRTACVVATALRIARPVTVLFDDYSVRPRYHRVERILGAPRMIGRQARFDLTPGMIPAARLHEVIAEFFQVRLSGEPESYYAA